jgi:transposase
MIISSEESDRIEMNREERDRLKVLHGVRQGERTQKEAARLLRLTVRQIRRLVRRLEASGDQGLIHRLRGRPSNRGLDEELRQKVLAEYERCYQGFGPTLASEKLAEQGLVVSHDTLRRWLLTAELWQRQRQRDKHRQRRARRACFGELVQMDTSIHDWLEGRGEDMVLIAMIDDATNWIHAGFYPGETLPSHLHLLWQWLKKNGRPLALYTDRDSIFEPQSKGRHDPQGQTQFGRALAELGIERVTAYSPQAKGRVERFFQLAQDRWVKEMRLAAVTTRAQANEFLRRRLLPQYNRRFTVAAARQDNAHRELGPEHCLAAILSVQAVRVVDNDYTVHFHNRCFQLLPPAWPGLRRGKVLLEQRLDGTLLIRFGEQYLRYQEIAARPKASGRRRPPSQSTASENHQDQRGGRKKGGCSGKNQDQPRPKEPYRPAADHPWRGKNRK